MRAIENLETIAWYTLILRNNPFDNFSFFNFKHTRLKTLIFYDNSVCFLPFLMGIIIWHLFYNILQIETLLRQDLKHTLHFWAVILIAFVFFLLLFLCFCTFGHCLLFALSLKCQHWSVNCWVGSALLDGWSFWSAIRMLVFHETVVISKVIHISKIIIF